MNLMPLHDDVKLRALSCGRVMETASQGPPEGNLILGAGAELKFVDLRCWESSVAHTRRIMPFMGVERAVSKGGVGGEDTAPERSQSQKSADLASRFVWGVR
jgi:hypothetical protein